MKLKVQYPTTQRHYISKATFQHVSREAELEPFRIIRRPCGTGAAASRYYYFADFPAPKDAAFVYDGYIREPINRRQNPHFDPKKFTFSEDVCRLNAHD